MKILFIDTPLDPPGGGQISLFTILKNLNNYNIRVFIDKDCGFKKMLIDKGLDVSVVKIKNLFFEIKKYRPNIVHINSACTRYTFFSAFFSKIFGCRVIWHNRVVESSPLKERVITKFVDKIIVISDVVGNKFRYCLDRVIKLYNPIDFKEIYKVNNREKIKEKLNIPIDSKIIGVFSRLEKWKGHKLLFEVFAKMKDKNIFLVVCGGGSEEKNLKKFVSEFGIEDRVLFLGFKENVYDYMNICDVIVNPSVEPEPFGRTIVEAMALKKIVISTDLGAPKEIIENYINGVLVEPNSNSIYSALVKVLNDPILYNRISEMAIKRAKDFDINNYIEKLKHIYLAVYEENSN